MSFNALFLGIYTKKAQHFCVQFNLYIYNYSFAIAVPLLLLATVIVVDAASTARPPPAGAKCAAISCPTTYEPICGGLKEVTTPATQPITFGSACVLGKYNCETQKSEFR